MEKGTNIVVLRCPKCFNEMKTKIQKDKVFKGQCPVCKTVVFSKQHSKATFMKIFEQ